MRQRHRSDTTRRKDGGGFTLIELMVVLTIIAILITFLIPVLYEAIAQARYTKWGSTISGSVPISSIAGNDDYSSGPIRP